MSTDDTFGAFAQGDAGSSSLADDAQRILGEVQRILREGEVAGVP
ncbi:MAG: hypothetical protein QOF49_66, partial [Chloroflexota bacterium]|nr:hypothetical protein [Chloroflexota bacterium]